MKSKMKFVLWGLFAVLVFMAGAVTGDTGMMLAAPSVAVTSNYAGEVADVIMAALKNGNETLEKGSLYVEPGVTKQLSIPIMTTADDVITEALAEPSTAAEAFVWTERTIVPASMMFFDKVNPRNFENVWRPFQPQGPLVDRVDNPKIKAAIIAETTKTIGKQLSKLIWQGDVGAGGASPLRFFDGFIKRMNADGTTIKPTPAGNIVVGNVISILEACEAAIPSTIWGDPDVVFHMNTQDFRLYLQAARALDFKGSDIGDAVAERFAGRQIRYYDGLPKNYVVVAKATAGKDSNLWAGADVESDVENVKIERFRPESENFIVKLLFKFNVNYAIGSEIVFYKPA
jgi:hypothetical protein